MQLVPQQVGQTLIQMFVTKQGLALDKMIVPAVRAVGASGLYASFAYKYGTCGVVSLYSHNFHVSVELCNFSPTPQLFAIGVWLTSRAFIVWTYYRIIHSTHAFTVNVLGSNQNTYL